MLTAADSLDKYSVLMSVCYKDNPAYLKQSVDSMLGQTVKPEQFVLVKDGPLSPSLDVLIDRYKNKHPEIFEVVKLSENKGLGIALDEGIKHCRNELVARMDADDISCPDRCERQLKCFAKDPELSVVSGNIGEFDEDPAKIVSIRTVPEHNQAIMKRMRIRSAFNHPAVMYKKSDVIRCGGYGTLRRKQDHVLFSHMLSSGCKGYNIQDIILLFRADGNSIRRRKSWTNCRAYIEAQRINYRRGECSWYHFAFVVFSQIMYFVLPAHLVSWLVKSVMRNRNSAKA